MAAMKNVALMAAAAALVAGASAGPLPSLRQREMEPEPASRPDKGGKVKYRGSRSGLNPEKERLRAETNAKIHAQRAAPESINEKYLSAAARRRRRAEKHQP